MVATTPKLRQFHLAATKAGRVVEACLDRGRRSVHTQRAYRDALASLAEFMLGPPDEKTDVDRHIERAVGRILKMKPGTALQAVSQFASSLRMAGKSSATIRHRQAVFSSMIGSAARIGESDWSIAVEFEKVSTEADTDGPTRDGVMAMIAATRAIGNQRKRYRDIAIVRLLFDLGLRRGEAVALMLADVDFDRKRLAVVGKGAAGGRVWIDMPHETFAATANWIAMRGYREGPLLISLWPGAKTERPITGEGVAMVTRDLSTAAGIRPVSPHALRHAAITEAVILTGGDVMAVMRFSRHRDVKMVVKYVDRVRATAGSVARMVASGERETLSGVVYSDK